MPCPVCLNLFKPSLQWIALYATVREIYPSISASLVYNNSNSRKHITCGMIKKDRDSSIHPRCIRIDVQYLDKLNFQNHFRGPIRQETYQGAIWLRGKARQGKARQEALHLDLRKWDTFRWNYLFCCEKRSRYVEYIVVFKFLEVYSILWKIK